MMHRFRRWFYPENDDKIDRDTIELNDKEFTIINASVTWDLENMTFKSINWLLIAPSTGESQIWMGFLYLGPLL